MRTKLLHISVIPIVLLLPFCGSSQNNFFEAPLTNKIQRLHFQQIKQGKQYHYYYPNIKGHQYWGNSVYETGTLTYEGISYQEVLLKYDNYNNLLVTTVVQNGLTNDIILDNSRIQGFIIHDQQFIHIVDGTGLLAPDFYILAFPGTEVQLYIKTQKTIVGNTGRPGELLKKFVQKDSHILLVEGEQYFVNNRKDVLKAFSKKPELVVSIKSSNLRFKKNELTASLMEILDGNLN